MWHDEGLWPALGGGRPCEASYRPFVLDGTWAAILLDHISWHFERDLLWNHIPCAVLWTEGNTTAWAQVLLGLRPVLMLAATGTRCLSTLTGVTGWARFSRGLRHTRRALAAFCDHCQRGCLKGQWLLCHLRLLLAILLSEATGHTPTSSPCISQGVV